MKRRSLAVVATAACAAALGAAVIFLGTYGSRRPDKSARTPLGPADPLVAGYFPADYRSAREAFLHEANRAGAAIESFQCPFLGPDEKPIFSDVALLGPEDASQILVLGSGTHGVEGFAGSGIQTGLFREGILSDLPPGVSVLLIHAINPYGFAHLRRFNEHNVDLNRNFRDFSEDSEPNPGYEELADVIAPGTMSFGSELKTWSRILWLRATGYRRLQDAITGGQYAHPDGLFYGGTAAEWSNIMLHSIIDRYLRSADRVVVVDFHTGLGTFGSAEIILNVPTGESAAVDRAVEIWPSENVRATIGDESVSSHLDASLKVGFANALSDKVTATSLEFGTEPLTEVFKALREENWLHHHGGSGHPDEGAIKTRLLEAFCPDSDEWKTAVWSKGRQVVERSLSWMEGAS